MRIGEICALQFKDIDFDEKIIHVNKTIQRIYNPLDELEPSKIVITPGKTKNSIREIPITDEILKILKTIKINDDYYVLSNSKKAIEPRTYRKFYNKFMNEAGVQPIKFHALRHTFASINIENGVDVKTISDILGHSDISITLKTYTHTTQKAKVKAIQRFNDMFKTQQEKMEFTSKYKGNVCCINKKNAKCDFIGTIQDIAEYIDMSSKYVCNVINGLDDDETYEIVPKIEGITHKNESLTDPQHPEQYKKMPILEDVYNVLLESEDTKRLAHILNRLVHGSASSFNQQTNVDLTNKYTVLDISELTGSSDLLTVGMFVALDYVWDKAKENRTEEKAIFVDEVWQLIGASSNRLAAEFVLEIAKIIRAYSGAGIFATQDLNDFFALDDGKYGKGIINNCKTKIILNMEDEEAQRVKTILHLSETEVMNITHSQRGNGLISTNNNNITVEFKASNLEKELITTDRQELLEILAKQKKQAV